MVTKKQRRRRIARAKWERQQQRRDQRARKRRRNGVVVGAVLGVVVALVAGFLIVRLVGGDSEGTDSGAPARVEPQDRDLASAPGDRLPSLPVDSAFQVNRSSPSVVESSSGHPGSTTADQPTAGRYSNGADRLERSVVIDKTKITV